MEQNTPYSSNTPFDSISFIQNEYHLFEHETSIQLHMHPTHSLTHTHTHAQQVHKKHKCSLKNAHCRRHIDTILNYGIGPAIPKPKTLQVNQLCFYHMKVKQDA